MIFRFFIHWFLAIVVVLLLLGIIYIFAYLCEHSPKLAAVIGILAVSAVLASCTSEAVTEKERKQGTNIYDSDGVITREEK